MQNSIDKANHDVMERLNIMAPIRKEEDIIYLLEKRIAQQY